MIKERARQIRAQIENMATDLDDETALEFPEVFPKWSAESVEYKVGDRVRYEEVLYKVLLDHTSQASWTPDASPSLFVRVDDPHIEWPEWVQPIASTDAYPLGAKVSHNDKHWISNVDANVWEPGVYGWDEASE